MKKIFLLGTMSVFVANSFAAMPGDGDKSNTIEIHAKGSANSTWLFNNNISNAGNEQDYAAGWGYSYGVGFNMYFGNVGFGVEGLMASHTGSYAGTINTVNAMGTNVAK